MQRLREKPVIGTKYGQWTVIGTNIKTSNLPNNRMVSWKVQCTCGKITFRDSSSLRSGRTKACMSCAKTIYNSDTYIHAYFNRLQIRIIDKGFSCNITVSYLERLFKKQKGKCALSGLSLDFKPFKLLSQSTASLDRIRSDKGYIIGNVQWVHKNVNMMKGSLSQNDFINFCKLITKNNEYKV